MDKRKILALGLILVLSVSVIGFADNHVTKIEAFLAGDLNFNVDGEQWIPKDVDGSDLTPIIYKDRTYIPVRSLLEEQGVKVGYEDDTRTVLLDYPTLEANQVDKSSPYLITSLLMKEDDTAGIGVEYKQVTVKKNPDFDIESMKITSVMDFDLSEKAEIVIDDRMSGISIDEILASDDMWKFNSVVLNINKKTGLVEKINISTENVGEPLASKIGGSIKLSCCPLKLTITVTF